MKEQQFIQDSQVDFWTYQNMAKDAIDAYGVHNLPSTKKEARALFKVNHWFGAEFEISDEKANDYLYEDDRGKRSEMNKVKARMKRVLKRSFINQRDRYLDELYS